MKRFLLSLFIIIAITSNVYATQLDDAQLKEDYAKSADVYTKAETNATIENAIAAISSGGATAKESTGTFISANVFEFDADYSTAEVMFFRNGVYQPRRLFTTADVAGKTRIVFNSSVNDSDEIVLISVTGN